MCKTFQKTQKLTKNSEFKQVFNSARKLYSNKCAIYFCANQLVYPRIGIIAAKKNIPGAVQRNVFKRVTRESFRAIKQQLRGIDVVVMANRAAATANKSELRKCLDELWQKLILLQPA